MKRIVFSVYDRRAELFMAPFLMVSQGQATRSFGDEVNRADRENVVHQHPEDFELFEFGTWDDVTGRYELFGAPRRLVLASDLVVR